MKILFSYTVIGLIGQPFWQLYIGNFQTVTFQNYFSNFLKEYFFRIQTDKE